MTPTRTLIDAALRETAAAVVGGAVAGHRPSRGLAVCNLHDLAEAANAIRGGMARIRPDAIVLTEEVHGALTSGVQIVSQRDGMSGATDLFQGVIVFSFASNKEALEKAEELRLGGRRVHCYIHVPKKVEELLAGPDEIMRVQTADSIDPRTCPPGTSTYDMSPRLNVVESDKWAHTIEERTRLVTEDSNGVYIGGVNVRPGLVGPGSPVIVRPNDAPGQEAQGGAGGVGEAVDHQLPDGERVPGDRDQQRGHEGGQPLHPVQQDQRVQ